MSGVVQGLLECADFADFVAAVALWGAQSLC